MREDRSEARTGAQNTMSCGRVSIVRGTSAARSEMAVGAKSKAGV